MSLSWLPSWETASPSTSWPPRRTGRPEELLGALRQALAADWLVETGDQLAFRHRLMREVIDQQLTNAVRQNARRRGQRPGAPGAPGSRPPRPESAWAELSAAENAVARLAARGDTDREMAGALFLSRHTVDSHLRRIFAKLGVSSGSSWPGWPPSAAERPVGAFSTRGPSFPVDCLAESALYADRVGTGDDGVAGRVRGGAAAAAPRARLTQQEVADAAGLSLRTVSDLERGAAATPQRETVRLLAGALHLTGAERVQFETAARGRPLTVVSQAAAAAAVRSLPRDVASFTGRERELEQLAESAAATGGVVGIHAIGGMAGVGKTAFAVHAAHQLAASSPAGSSSCCCTGTPPDGHRWTRRTRWPATRPPPRR